MNHHHLPPRNVEFFCLLYGAYPPSYRIFTVYVSPDTTISALREHIVPQATRDVPADAFILLTPKATNPIPISPYDSLRFDETISKLDLNTSEGRAAFEELNLSLTIKQSGLSRPVWRHLHILIVNPAGIPWYLHRNYSPIPRNWSLRDDIVSNLYNQALRDRAVLVCGPPGSGKTTLLSLLGDFIIKKEPNPLVQRIFNWHEGSNFGSSFDSSRAPPFAFSYSDVRFASKELQYWVLLDEAHVCYEQDTLWNLWVKPKIAYTRNIFFVVFALYEPLYGELSPKGIPAPPFHFLTEIVIFAQSLRFSREEYNDYLRIMSSESNSPTLAIDLRNWVYDISQGHIGAISLLCHHATKCHRNAPAIQPSDVTDFRILFNDIFRSFDPANWYLPDSAFSRGLPPRQELKLHTPLYELLTTMLRVGYMTLNDVADESYETAVHAHTRGWIDMQRQPGGNAHLAQFASPLHRLWLSWTMGRHATFAEHLQKADLVDVLSQAAVAFSFDASTPACEELRIQPPSDIWMQEEWQRELWRVLHVATDGTVLLSPEIGETRVEGHMSFYIPEKKWGIGFFRGAEDAVQFYESLSDGFHRLWIENDMLESLCLIDFEVATPQNQSHDGIQLSD
ncbi:hypothetical protein AX16_007409 [Volvariella volvacea WC 439]|nr:hypothetical protein AX16_007409 [Volvariella volvacea WC 439]